MREFYTGHNITEDKLLTETDLLYFIKSEEITALDPDNYNPINWNELENEFKEICKLYEEPGQEFVATRHIDFDGPETITHSGPLPMERVITHDDTYITDGKEYTNKRIPWSTLLHRLKDPTLQTSIPERQYNEIVKGWSNTIKLPYALDAVYRRSETDKLTKASNSVETLDVTELLSKLLEADLPEDFSPKAKGGITNSINKLKDQLPQAFNFLSTLIFTSTIKEDINSPDRYTSEQIEQLAEKEGIKTPMARSIYKSLPSTMKK